MGWGLRREADWGEGVGAAEGGGRVVANLRGDPERTPDSHPRPLGGLLRTPQGLALSPPGLRLSGASSRPPQPRGPPLPGPSAPFIFPRLRLGFCWFLGDKNRLK